ncbi:hypothetical protein JG687_00017872 [Phytophthora cactorum]|uniref:Uncharacterized protein n=1 Tax=Phytophthora cactorum TaxID=29920 RepID=A0A329RJM9_9STRA|nr:hypothetical protein Pcac1_g3453 [Phytophthora cactorum]KAG2802831.1 hypothetical protein PC112_g19459 [Phytophthora cactorum]KAG2803865.1 hypothetical protein PC111_g18509 [Phytophthora cactorum]KAG2832968.1 hypothetical protein PC113_g20657 [Phytophthora cactorum]KAG2879821.1 hypothetical protein PC114_g22373 [Phytophthora cactorum]
METFVDRHALSTYQGMNLVVHKNFTFANVDNETLRAAIKFDSISPKILKARMIACVKLIDPFIIAEIKDEKFVLVFDGVYC